MANYNLTSQQIKDTYEQLVQISGSALVDGTGSAILVNVDSASFATTASFALSASSDWNDITNKPSGIVSSSAQTLENVKGQTIEPTEISGAFGTIKSRLNFFEIRPELGSSLTGVRIGDEDLSNYVDITTTDTTFYGADVTIVNNLQATDITATGRFIGVDFADVENKPSGLVSSSAQTIANISGSTIYPSSVNADVVTATTPGTGFIGDLLGDVSANDVSTTTLTSSQALISGNLVVNGTASFAYLESITGSANIIGDAFIILNNDTPAQRYAGLVVQDSGSTNNTASFEFDGQTNDWFYEYTDDGGATAEFGVVMFGPGYNTKGSHVYPSNNTILKGTGDHHIVDSIITDDGSTVTVGGDIEGNVVTANTYFAGDLIGTASLADTSSYVSAGNIDGTVANATTASYALTASAATTFTISTQLDLGSSVITVDSASATGSLVDNIHPAIASGSTAIKHIVTIDQTAYDTISGSGNVYDDTFYIIEDAGDNVYPGNLQVSGQIYTPIFAGTIASSTSSIDFDNGNFATLNCATSTFLANPTNLQGGTTYTLIVTNGANISGYGTAWKFAGGTEPTLSANTDVITAVSDGTSLYAAALADFS